MCRIGDATEIDVLVTDADPAKSSLLPRLAQSGIRILHASHT
jgi:hypothetical protein